MPPRPCPPPSTRCLSIAVHAVLAKLPLDNRVAWLGHIVNTVWRTRPMRWSPKWSNSYLRGHSEHGCASRCQICLCVLCLWVGRVYGCAVSACRVCAVGVLFFFDEIVGDICALCCLSSFDTRAPPPPPPPPTATPRCRPTLPRSSRRQRTPHLPLWLRHRRIQRWQARRPSPQRPSPSLPPSGLSPSGSRRAKTRLVFLSSLFPALFYIYLFLRPVSPSPPSRRLAVAADSPPPPSARFPICPSGARHDGGIEWVVGW